jgi:hypothetical protein
LSISIPNIQFTDIDTLQGSFKLSLLFKEQSYISFTYRLDIKSIMDLMDTLMANSILDSGSKYPLLRFSSVLLLNSFRKLLTLNNDTIIDAYTPILTVMSIDLINTYYQTLRSEHCIK